MLEMRHDNIRVSDVLPGSVLTEFNNNAITAGADWKLSPDDVARVVVDLLDTSVAQPAEPRRTAAVEAAEG